MIVTTVSKHTKQGHESEFYSEATLYRVFKKGLLRRSHRGLTPFLWRWWGSRSKGSEGGLSLPGYLDLRWGTCGAVQCPADFDTPSLGKHLQSLSCTCHLFWKCRQTPSLVPRGRIWKLLYSSPLMVNRKKLSLKILRIKLQWCPAFFFNYAEIVVCTESNKKIKELRFT